MPPRQLDIGHALVELAAECVREIGRVVMPGHRTGHEPHLEAGPKRTVAELPVFVAAQGRIESLERVESCAPDGDVARQQVLQTEAMPRLPDVPQHHFPPAAQDDAEER